jgi:glycosyltransferase involved in cell wall biosynthesis
VVSPRRITLVADQALGYHRTGGLGTATTFLALALGRMGHDVEILYFGELSGEPVDSEWSTLYDDAGVRIRPLPAFEVPVEPPYFRRMRAVEAALRADPPDVAIVQDLGAPGYVAIRLRQLGLAFENTLFVVYCHGSRQWITNMARKVRVLPGALAVSRLEQACVELADVAVSPSAYMVEWMRGQGWRLPEATSVIPLVTRTAATGEAPPQSAANENGGVHRLAFFGRLEERKGVRPFVAGVNAVRPELLEGVELEFVGRATTEAGPELIDGLLSDTAKQALRGVSFETELDQHEALARLSRPGTLVVVPSIEDNSPNVVYECLERRIPFLASAVGGTAELVAQEDRARILFEPTPQGVATALERALTTADGLRAPRPAFDEHLAVQRWAEVVAGDPARAPALVPPANADEWEVREPQLLDLLLRAQGAADADVVTCGVRVGDTEHLFSGEPGGLGLLANDYGKPALIRRALLHDVEPAWPVVGDPDWPLLARLSARGARIVSIPLPLVAAESAPGTLERFPTDALLVVEELERSLPHRFRSLVRLAAGLAAEAQQRVALPQRSLLRRVLRRLR